MGLYRYNMPFCELILDGIEYGLMLR
jgi:hypothetical protein